MKIYFSAIFNVFADEGHPEGTPHNEAVSIDPLMVIVIIGVVLVVGFVVWKFVLQKKSSGPIPPSSVPPSLSQENKTQGSEQ